MPALSLALMVTLLSSRALADAELSRQTIAERLFQSGKAAMEAEQYEVACTKLRDSHALDPAGGTVLLLSLCWEARGKLASAWLGYHEALAYARRDGRSDRAQRAAERLRAIEPRLIRLTLHAPSSAPPVRVLVNGVEVPESAHETGFPLDPGEHTVKAEWRGFPSFVKRVVARREGERIRVDIPPPRRAAPKPVDAAPPPSTAQRDWATVLLAAGGSAVAAGLVAGGIAWHRERRADAICADVECTDGRAVDENAQARTAATFATASIGVGLALGIAGGALLFTAPSSREAAGVRWSTRW